MLPLSRPLFDAHAARLMTLCVSGALVTSTLLVIAVLTA
jgi:hypothetical protein